MIARGEGRSRGPGDARRARRRRCGGSRSTARRTVVAGAAERQRPRARRPMAAPRLKRMPRRSDDAARADADRGAEHRLRRRSSPSTGVSLPVRQGEVLALIGPSGCGKTTLLRSLNRLVELTPTATRGGRILLDGEDVDGFDVTWLRRRVGMLFQQPNPFPMSIFDNVAYGLRERGSKKPRKRQLRAGGRPRPCTAPASSRRSRTTSTIPRCALSGGQQQRLCIARSLAVAARGAAARRALLGARPDLDPDDRGDDRLAALARSRS